MITVSVALSSRAYDVVVSQDLESFGSFARQLTTGEQAMIVTDENVVTHATKIEAILSQAGFRTALITLPPGESQKQLATASQLYDEFAKRNVSRKTVVVPVGGGVIGDLAGFVAATYNRGLPLLMVPTTLLAMVDSSVGGKVGINHPQGKNLIGAFHQPVGVWIDPSFMSTLEPREFLSGLGEVVKYGMIMDAEFFCDLEQKAPAILKRDPEVLAEVIAHCCRLKAQVVVEDERETSGRRMILNYGHTFAHAFETIGGYGTWLHGEAVSAGMIAASRFAEHRQWIEPTLTQRQETLLSQFRLPIRIPSSWDVQAMLDVMRRDKKNVTGQVRLILPTRMGEVKLCQDVQETEVIDVLSGMSE